MNAEFLKTGQGTADCARAKGQKLQGYLLKLVNFHGITTLFPQIVLETGYVLGAQMQAIQNILTALVLKGDTKTLQYFSMHAHLTVFIARTGTSKKRPLNPLQPLYIALFQMSMKGLPVSATLEGIQHHSSPFHLRHQGLPLMKTGGEFLEYAGRRMAPCMRDIWIR